MTSKSTMAPKRKHIPVAEVPNQFGTVCSRTFHSDFVNYVGRHHVCECSF